VVWAASENTSVQHVINATTVRRVGMRFILSGHPVRPSIATFKASFAEGGATRA
jgi:hypothetical protein